MSKFQKRHYEAIAKVLKENFETNQRLTDATEGLNSAVSDLPLGIQVGLEQVTLDMMKMFKEDNEGFSESQFLSASGYVPKEN